MAGAKLWFAAYGGKGSDPEGILKAFCGKTESEVEAESEGVGGEVTLLDKGVHEFFDVPFVKVAFEFPVWGAPQRNFATRLLAEILNKALSEGTDVAIQFNPLREEG